MYDGITQMIDKVSDSFDVMLENLKMPIEKVTLDKASEIEDDIDRLLEDIRLMHLRSLEKKEDNVQNGLLYKEVYSLLEKVGDHVFSVSKALVGNIEK